MSEFQPTFGKWNDIENYDIDLPKWRKLLDVARRHHDVSEVCAVMKWLVDRGIENSWRLDYLACYGIIGSTFCLDEEVKSILSTAELEHIHRFPESVPDLRSYTVTVLQETHVPEQIIEEFDSAYPKLVKPQ